MSPYLRLLWKEYRVARPFWLSLVGLVIFLDGLVMLATSDSTVRTQGILSLSFGAPVFFALGCSGAAFAMELEEGTFAFLQAIPVTARQLLTAKVTLIVAGSLGMAMILWTIAFVVSPGQFTARDVPAALLSDSSLTVLGAVAWPLLFSLLVARPLLAITLGAAAACAVPAVLSHYLSNHQVASASTAIAAVALGVDVYLGLRWLHGGGVRLRVPKLAVADSISPSQAITAERELASAALKPDLSAVFSRLTWQTCRQSWPMMAALFVLAIVLVYLQNVASHESFDYFYSHFAGQILAGIAALMALVAALAGTFVFHTDQESYRFRFFVEHNVSPRHVWPARHLPWIAALATITLAVLITRLGPQRVLQLPNVPTARAVSAESTLPEFHYVAFIFVCATLSYAAGQWCSMLIKSGVLAGPVAVVLAALLCGWSILMYFMRISWLWSVAPIPFVLLWATWLRAPDWIRENTRWPARGKAAATVLLPVAALFAAVPLYRVYSVPLVSPGFDPDAYVAQITPEAQQTAEEYRRIAGRLTLFPWDRMQIDRGIYTSNALYPITRNADRAPTHEQQRWLEENSEVIERLLANSRRGACAFENPADVRRLSSREIDLASVLVIDGRRLEFAGDAEKALDRYFAALRVIDHLTALEPQCTNFAISDLANGILTELTWWGAKRDQTADRIKTAIDRLNRVDAGILHLDDQLKSDYVLQRREFFELHQSPTAAFYHPDSALTAERVWNTLMPWEKYRGVRQLNLLSSDSLKLLADMRAALDHNQPLAPLVPLRPRFPEQANPFDGWLLLYQYDSGWPPLELANFEANRRATMIILALQANDHGSFYEKSGRGFSSPDEIDTPYLDKVPLDPFTARPFVYLPGGIPAPRTPLEATEFTNAGSGFTQQYQTKKSIGQPCLWSAGPGLLIRRWSDYQPTATAIGNREDVTFYCSRYDGNPLPAYSAWGAGYWFPVPNQDK